MVFSIIIPHHNIPDLLQRCLDSIPQRDDLEVIVVDDNSDPAVVDFDNFPGKDRPDVKILRNDKRWAGTARNKGIEVATGRWLIFADADDYFNYCFNALLDKYADSEADIVYFNANSLDCECYCHTKQTDWREQHINRLFGWCLEGRSKGEVYLRYVWGEPWAKMFRRKMVVENNFRFDATPIHNDTTFVYMCGHYARKIEIDKHCVYCVTYRPSSLHLSISEENLLARVDVFARKERFMRDNTPYALLDRVDRSHYITLVDLVGKSREARRKAWETLKVYRLTGVRTHFWFWYYAVRRITRWVLGRE
ncbi:MAG: glycosyltransferase family 2 protein [Bacteroidales bacterium]|nr:glycosyltransferase family 2 protein [Bacteroidales bacterium]